MEKINVEIRTPHGYISFVLVYIAIMLDGGLRCTLHQCYLRCRVGQPILIIDCHDDAGTDWHGCADEGT